MPFYGVVSAKRERVRDVIEVLLARRLLKRSGDRQYPVLEITRKGEEELERMRASLSPLQTPVEQKARAPEPIPPPQAPRRPSPAAMLDELLETLLQSDRDGALARLEELRMFHPREVVARLAARFELCAADERLQCRIVWTVGEAGEGQGLPFLRRCAASPTDAVRRLAASALRKLAE